RRRRPVVHPTERVVGRARGGARPIGLRSTQARVTTTGLTGGGQKTLRRQAGGSRPAEFHAETARCARDCARLTPGSTPPSASQRFAFPHACVRPRACLDVLGPVWSRCLTL